MAPAPPRQRKGADKDQGGAKVDSSGPAKKGGKASKKDESSSGSLPLLLIVLGVCGSGLFLASKHNVFSSSAQSPAPALVQESQATVKAAVREDADWNVIPGLESLDKNVARADLDQSSLPGVEKEPVVISTSPGVYLFDDLLTAEECDYLIAMAKDRLQPAGVVRKADDFYSREEEWRNNEQIWVTQAEEKALPMLRHILKRVHRVAHVTDEDAEGLQVGRYINGQKYEIHHDSDPDHDVMRPATMLMYLSEPESGGDTLFPLTKRRQCDPGWKELDGVRKYGASYCCDQNMEGTIKVKPKKGRAILFFNHDLDMKKDPKALHAACPAYEGAKWIAQRWFRMVPYQRVTFDPDHRFDGVPMPLAAPVDLPVAGWDGRIRPLWKKNPRIYLLEDFLSQAEVDRLLSLATADGQNSVEVPRDTEVNDAIVSRLVKRMHRAAYVPEPHGQSLTLERVLPGTKPGPGFQGKAFATLLVFLGDTGVSGDLVVPLDSGCTLPECCSMSADSKRAPRVRVPAKKGRAVLVYRDQKKVLENAFCPSSEGSEVWLAQRPFRSKKVKGGVKHAEDPAHDIVSTVHVL